MTADQVRGSLQGEDVVTEIEEKIAGYESQLAALMATPVFMNIQRLRGAIAALRELKAGDSNAKARSSKDAKREEDLTQRRGGAEGEWRK